MNVQSRVQDLPSPDEFDYPLPPELIAQEPLATRDLARLLVVDRASRSLVDARFLDLVEYLRSGDVLVANESRVIPARLSGRLDSGGSVELLLVRPAGPDCWEVMCRPARKLRPGTTVHFDEGLTGSIVASEADGMRLIEFDGPKPIEEALRRTGKVPLPPYIKHAPADPEHYQTIYSQAPGSVAAPTAGLHFTPRMLTRIRSRGVGIHFITLHVGPGTFAPVRHQDLSAVRLHAEAGIIPERTAAAIRDAKRDRRRVVAVGTTTTRLLEAIHRRHGDVIAIAEDVDLFIRPPFKFDVVDALVTNFHLPRSSLLMLVSAFAGQNLTRRAYQHAVASGYRFYSFGDATLIV